MKKHIFGFCITVLASAAFAELPTGDFMTWFGYDCGRDASGSGTSLYGAMAGQEGSYLNYSVLLGTLSGYRAYGANRSVGLGPWSLYGARSIYGTVAIGPSAGRNIFGCTNCVFIGKDAGRGMTNATDCVDIGGNIIVRDGYAEKFGYNFSLCDAYGNELVSSYYGEGHFHNFYSYGDNFRIAYFLKGNGNLLGLFDTGYGFTKNGGVVGLDIGNIDCGSFVIISDLNFRISDANQNLREYVDGRIESNDGSRMHIVITDEDTGERYIIKVKSGALKLYRVEETEE